MPPDPLADRLARRTLALVDIASPSGSEQELYAYVKREVPLEPEFDDGESLLYTRRRGRPLVLLAGHTDTVPAQDNLPGRIADGAVHGLGATDMKGGLAVMIELACRPEPPSAYDLALLFFPREELGPDANPLPGVFAATPSIDEAALVICLEPTDNTLQLGCLGNINARVRFEGRAAHSARPWLGVNAIRLAFEGLRGVLALEPNDVEVEGLVFREVLSVTTIDDCGNATNVIPALVECTLNFRYAPSRSPAEAETRLRELVPVPLEIVHHSPAAHVAAGSPLLQQLERSGGFTLEPKQAWTNVADFAARGLDAVNLGPGATRFAHTADEQVEIAALARTYDALARFLDGRGADVPDGGA
jgi:succinyl-diaminopimelate desuccinylase